MSDLMEILLSLVKGRRTVNLPLFITKHHDMKACDGVEILVRTMFRSAMSFASPIGPVAALPTKSEAGSTPVSVCQQSSDTAQK